MNPNIGYAGEYLDWKAAQAVATGYDSEEILEKVVAAMQKIKSGDAIYERDSVLFPEPQYSWPVATALLWAAAANNGTLEVIDFGGSLGSSFVQNRPFLAPLARVSWTIVEQKSFVDMGRKLFANDQLKFHYSIASCPTNHRSHVVLFSSSLQYLDDPYTILSEAVCSGAGMIIIDRTLFVDGHRDKITVQNVPSNIYNAKLPVWLFSEDKLVEFLDEHYRLFCRFNSYLNTAELDQDKRRLRELGMIFIRRESRVDELVEKN